MIRRSLDSKSLRERIEILKQCYFLYLQKDLDINNNYQIKEVILSASDIKSYIDEYYILYATEEEKELLRLKKYNEEIKNNPNILEMEKLLKTFIQKDYEDKKFIKNGSSIFIKIDEDRMVLKKDLSSFVFKYANLKDYKLYNEKIRTFTYEEKEKEPVIKKSTTITREELKDNHDTLIAANFEEEKVEEYLKKKKIKFKTLNRRVKKYIEYYATEDEKQYYESITLEKEKEIEEEKTKKIKEKHINAKSNIVITTILKLDNKDAIEYLKEKGVNPCNIKNYIRSYTKRHELTKEEEQKIHEKINNYKEALIKEKNIKNNYIKNEESKKEEIIITYIINEILNSNLNKQEILDKYKIEKSEFDNYVNKLKSFNEDLYNKYQESNNEILRKKQKIIILQTEKIITLIKNGIVIGNEKRDFDIIDYYMIFKFEPQKLIKIVRKVLDVKKITCLSQFANKYKVERPFTSETLNYAMSEMTEINCKKDERGIPMKGTGIILSKEDKENIVEYLKNNNIQITDKTYQTAIKRFSLNLAQSNKEEVTKKLINQNYLQ